MYNVESVKNKLMKKNGQDVIDLFVELSKEFGHDTVLDFIDMDETDDSTKVFDAYDRQLINYYFKGGAEPNWNLSTRGGSTVFLDGKQYHVDDLAAEFGISPNVFRKRLEKGMEVEDALLKDCT